MVLISIWKKKQKHFYWVSYEIVDFSGDQDNLQCELDFFGSKNIYDVTRIPYVCLCGGGREGTKIPNVCLGEQVVGFPMCVGGGIGIPNVCEGEGALEFPMCVWGNRYWNSHVCEVGEGTGIPNVCGGKKVWEFPMCRGR